MWSTAHHGSAIISMICSATVAVLATEGISAGDEAILAAILSGVAATLTGISTFTGFARKWRANRSTQTALDELMIDMSAPNPDETALRERYKEIIRRHDQGILGEVAA